MYFLLLLIIKVYFLQSVFSSEQNSEINYFIQNETSQYIANESLPTASRTFQNQNSVSILFGGDISMDKPIRKGNGSACPYYGLLANVSRYFKEVDYSIVNLEAPFVSRETAKHKFLPGKGIHNMAWPEGIGALTYADVKGVTISNNHMGDFGSDAVDLTYKVLKENNIDIAGLTYGIKPPYSSQIPIIKEIKGVKIGILAYCADSSGECVKYRPGLRSGPALLNKITTKHDILSLKPQVDVVVLFLHWGTEYMSIPNEDQREIAVKLSKLGVDLIIGSHPHVTQGHEWINDTLIHYSLGNFVFHPHFTYMGALAGKADAKKIHERAMRMAKRSRGPAGFTELFQVQLSKNGVENAYYLPIRIHVDQTNGCFYPKAKVENQWLEVCGKEDDNCYAPRHGQPWYP